jgi:tetratricopeptide (TPR) repeat protein
VGINVRLEADAGGIVDQQMTDSTGKVTFAPKSFTMYAVTIHELGYRDVRQRVDLSHEPTAAVSVTLVPIAGHDASKSSQGEADRAVSVADLNIPAPAMKEFDAGHKLLQEKHDVPGSIGHFRKATELYSGFTQAYVMLGLAYLQDQKLEQSQAALEQAVQLDPKSSAGYLTLGACLNQQKDYAGAEKALLTGLGLEPESPEGHYELAKTYWAQRRWQEAVPHAEKAEELQPQVPGVHVLMGNILLQKRDTPGALKEFNEYLRLDPQGSMSGSVRAMVSKLEKASSANP